MSDIHPGTPRDDADGSPFTVEDAGSTTDAADLVGSERARQNDEPFTGSDASATRVTSTEPVLPDTEPTRTDETVAASSGGAHAVGSTDDAVADRRAAGTDEAGTVTAGGEEPVDAGSGLSALDDGSIGHVFDQTNGVIDGLDGDSDGSAEGDVLSSGERADENPDFFHDAEVRGAGVDDSRVTGS